jgi:lysozyme family protein
VADITSTDFQAAFNHSMLYEIGPWWNPADPDVIAGNTGTTVLDRKCGFTNTPGDAGGVTKYGIAQNSHPELNVATMSLSDAMNVYIAKYWNAMQMDSIPHPLTILYFDCCVNPGPGRAPKFLQQAAGVTVDGQVGPATLAAVAAADQTQLINTISDLRAAYYQAVVTNHPEDAQFLNGWLRRNTEVQQFTIAQMPSQ